MEFLSSLTDHLWCPWLLGLFFAVGGYFTLRSGFFQLLPHRWLFPLFRLRRGRSTSSGLTQLQALTTALASTIGTGSIAGVATAIFFGGPGAVFWMWLSAFLGMMTSAAEKALAVAFRQPDPSGAFRGGPMCYMTQALPRLGKPLALCFSLACLLASLAGGGMVQSNSISAALAACSFDPRLSAWLTALAVGIVLFGGVRRVGAVSEQLVPLMASLFLLGGGAVLVVHRAALPAAFRLIVRGAFCPQAALGGYSLSAALRYGVARGVFTNEAGLGSSAIAHAAAGDATPQTQARLGMLEVFVATLLICTVTSLVILTSGVYSPADALARLSSGALDPSSLGVPLFTAAFSTVFPRFGAPFVAFCLLLFAFTSLLGWGYYGERALETLLPRRKVVLPFRLLFLASILLGGVWDVEAVWVLSDLANALMALPNLTALLLLSPRALALLDADAAPLSKSP